jgi:riboflavin kinase
MKNEKVSSLDFSKNPVQKGNLEKSEYLNLPDLNFFLRCQQQYRVNKGVFNTIDHWFYEYGMVNIIHRRIYLLAFLEYVTDGNSKPDHHKYIKFGNGGLTRRLHQFIEETETEKYTI